MTVTACPRCGFYLETLHTVEVGSLKLDYDGAIVVWKGQRVQISESERLMLLAIVRAGGAPVKRWILADAMGYDGEQAENQVAVHFHRIHKAFRAIDPAFDMIENIRIQGLRWRMEDA